MKKITIETALQFIENKFHEFTSIVNVDDSNILDIVCKDMATNQYYEVYTDEKWMNMKIVKIKF